MWCDVIGFYAKKLNELRSMFDNVGAQSEKCLKDFAIR